MFAVEGLGGLLPPGLEGLSTGSPPCVRGTGDLEKIWMLGWSLWKELSKSWHKTDPGCQRSCPKWWQPLWALPADSQVGFSCP